MPSIKCDNLIPLDTSISYLKKELEVKNKKIEVLELEIQKLLQLNERLKGVNKKVSVLQVSRFLERESHLIQNVGSMFHYTRKDNLKGEFLITYQGVINPKATGEIIMEIQEALGKDPLFGDAHIDWKLIQNAIVLLCNRNTPEKEKDVVDILIKADSFKRKFITTLLIQKELPHLTLDSKQITKILLDSGKWDFKLKNNSRQKQFFKINTQNTED